MSMNLLSCSKVAPSTSVQSTILLELLLAHIKHPLFHFVYFPWFSLGDIVFRGEEAKLWVITLMVSCHSYMSSLPPFSRLKKKKDAL